LYIQSNAKILDASVLIAFLSELKNPDLLYKITDIGYRLLVPTAVYSEMKNPTFDYVRDGAIRGKIELLDSIPATEIRKLKNRFPFLKNGELEVILWGRKLEEDSQKYHCILDDGAARKVAKKTNLIFTGTLGLINFIEERGIITSGERREIIKCLEESNFRMKSKDI